LSTSLQQHKTDDSRSLVGSGYLHNTVRVDLESDFNLRNTSGCWWDAGQLELSEEVVILRQRALTLVNLDQDRGLVIGSSRETKNVLDNMMTKNVDDAHLRLASRDNSVTGNELGEDTAGGLDSEGKCGNVDKDDIFSAFLP
jgi:NAD-specific glutamate dehydrogenase